MKNLTTKKSGFLLFLAILTQFSFAQFNIIVSGYTPYGCAPQTISFKMEGSGIDHYGIDFNDGSQWVQFNDSVVHTFTKGGYYGVYIESYDKDGGQIGSNYTSIDLNGSGLYINSSADTACVGEIVNFGFNNYLSQVEWNFGDPASGVYNSSNQSYPQHSFNQSGTYTILLIAQTQCGLDSTFKDIVVSNTAKPSADFWKSSQTVCPGDPVDFYPQSSNASMYKWTYGDPTSGSLDTTVIIKNKNNYNSNGSHIYNKAGIYVVTLELSNVCGQTNKKTDSVEVKGGQKWDSYSNYGIYSNNGSSNIQACPDDEINFYSQKTASKMEWDFGDGITSTEQNPKHIYSKIGEYDLSLKLTNGCGYDTTIYTVVKIGGNAGFNQGIYFGTYPESACPGDIVQFQTNINAKKIMWDFGDGFISTQLNAMHAFNSIGAKTITVKLTNNCGSDTTVTYDFTVTDTMKVHLVSEKNNNGDGGNQWGMPTNVACIGDSIIVYSMGGASYNIDFGDGYITTKTYKFSIPQGELDIAKHAYSSNGTFVVTLTFFNNCGNSASDTLHVTVGAGHPVEGELSIMQNDPFYTCQPINFVSLGGVTYKWKFSATDSVTITDNFIQRTFSTAGSYPVSVFITNGCSNTKLYDTIINIIDLPTPIVEKWNDTLYTNAEAVSYQWYLNDVKIPNAIEQFCISKITGLYKVEITDINGCKRESANYEDCYVKAGQDASICSGGSVQLNATGATSYAWSPSTGLSSTTIPNPVANPTVETTYIVIGSTGPCIVKDTIVIKMTNSLTANAGSDKIICKGEGVSLDGNGGGNYAWSSVISLDNAAIASPVASPTITTTYTLTVSSGSCTNSDKVVITVNVPVIPTINVSNDTLISSSAIEYRWYLNGNPIQDAIGKKFKPTSSGNYTVETSDINGCKSVSNQQSFTYTGLQHVLANTSYWTIYPNPANNVVYINLNSTSESYIDVMNMRGQVLINKMKVTKLTEQIDISNYSQGLYFIRVYGNNVNGIKKLIKN